MEVQEYVNHLKRITPELLEVGILAIIRKHEARAIDLNLMQLDDGMTPFGTRIEPLYSALTVIIKRGKGQPSDRVTLKDDGDFHNSFYLEADQFPVIFNARDIKTGLLSEKYGEENIFGLSRESLDIFLEEIKEDVIEFIATLLLLR